MSFVYLLFLNFRFNFCNFNFLKFIFSWKISIFLIKIFELYDNFSLCSHYNYNIFELHNFSMFHKTNTFSFNYQQLKIWLYLKTEKLYLSFKIGPSHLSTCQPKLSIFLNLVNRYFLHMAALNLLWSIITIKSFNFWCAAVCKASRFVLLETHHLS